MAHYLLHIRYTARLLYISAAPLSILIDLRVWNSCTRLQGVERRLRPLLCPHSCRC